MIRFPERFHASKTPGAGQIEPNYLEPEARTSDVPPAHRRNAKTPGAIGPRFDFTALTAVLGR